MSRPPRECDRGRRNRPRAERRWHGASRRVILAVAAATAVAGCAAPVWGTWVNPAADPRQQRQDEYECARQATFAAPAEAERATAFGECMRARGYRPAARR